MACGHNLRLDALLMSMLSLISCANSPSKEECRETALWVSELSGYESNMLFDGCIKHLSSEEAECLRGAGTKNIDRCPGLGKLNVDLAPFRAVYCYDVRKDSEAARYCHSPYVECAKARDNELREGYGKDILPCRLAKDAWAATFACRDSVRDTCAAYFSTEAACKIGRRSLLDRENNVSPCRSRGWYPDIDEAVARMQEEKTPLELEEEQAAYIERVETIVRWLIGIAAGLLAMGGLYVFRRSAELKARRQQKQAH